MVPFIIRWRVAFLCALVVCTGSAFVTPSATKTTRCAASGPASTPSRLRSVPSLVVFDLDHTLWTPELYQLRKLERANQYPVAEKDVRLFPAVKEIIRQVTEDERFADTKLAIASRTKSVAWAHDLLKQFGLTAAFDFVEIFPGDKKQHFRKLQQASGIDYKDMIFFDDARDGRWGNCEPVSQLGVLSVHCPNGMYEQAVWTNALERYAEWSAHKTPGTIIEGDNSVTAVKSADPNQRQRGEVKTINREKLFGFIKYGGRGTKDVFFHFSALPYGKEVEEGDALSFAIATDSRTGKDAAADIEILQTDEKDRRQRGEVKFINREKRFGFIKYGDPKKKDVFFHFSALPYGKQVEEGDALSFAIATDSRNGKDAAADIEILQTPADEETDADDDTHVTMRVFSMNLPFAALLSNGYKTLETRNGTMFTPYTEGTHMLLHVGQRTYPDGNRHIDVMKSGGLDDEEIQALKSLPAGFSKGMAVAIVELGDTFETTLEQRCDPDFQRAVAAFGKDSGMRATKIRRVEYLRKGVKVSGQGGVFKAKIERSAIPDGWLTGDEDASSTAAKKKGVYYSATF